MKIALPLLLVFYFIFKFNSDKKKSNNLTLFNYIHTDSTNQIFIPNPASPPNPCPPNPPSPPNPPLVTGE